MTAIVCTLVITVVVWRDAFRQKRRRESAE